MSGPYPARLEIFFGIGDFGWSTDHYYQTLITDLNVMNVAAKALVAAYANCLAYGITIDAARGTLNGDWRNSIFYQVPTPKAVVAGPPPSGPLVYNNYLGNGPATDPFDGINFRLEMGQAYRASEILSGFPAGALQQPSIYPWLSSNFANLQVQISYLMQELTGSIVEGVAGVNSQWGGLVRAKGTDGPATIPLVGAVCTEVGYLTLQSAVATPYDVGTPIRVLGITQPPNIGHVKANGTYNVLPYAGQTQVIVSAPGVGIGQQFFANGATMQQISLVLKQYTKWNFIVQTHRKRGRRFGAPRGRSKRRGLTAVV
jgi:hypothetical protein